MVDEHGLRILNQTVRSSIVYFHQICIILFTVQFAMHIYSAQDKFHSAQSTVYSMAYSVHCTI